MTVDMFSGLTFENRRLTDAVTGREHLTAYLRALLPSRIDDDDVFDLNVLMLNVINGLVTPYVGDGFAEVHSAAWEFGMPLDDVKFSEAFPKSIPGADGLESVFRALGVPPVDIDALLDPEACEDEAECTPAKLRAKYVSDFIAAMFADIQKGAVGQCDCETACAPLTSFQPDSFKTYYDQAVPPQWIWEGNEDTRSDEFPACRAITAKATNDGYEILDAEEAGSTVRTPGRLRVRRAPRRPRTDPHSPLLQVVYQCPADGGYLPIMTATYKPHTLMKDHLQWYKFSKAKSLFEPVKQAPEEFGQCVAACEASKTGYGTFETAFVSRCADQAMHKLFAVELQRLSEAGN